MSEKRPFFSLGDCVTKGKGYEEHLFITNPNSIPATFATYIMPFKHCYNTLMLLFPIEHKFLYPNKTPNTTYLLVPSRSLCSIRLTTTRNNSWYCEYMK